MTCDEFRKNYRDIDDRSSDLEEEAKQVWSEHLHECGTCSDWHQAQQVIDRGFDPERFPCVHTAFHSTFQCDQHSDPWDRPDVVLVYWENFDEYGIPIRDGGHSKITISHCPWCGIRLPESKRNLWVGTLESLGYEEPFLQDVPEEFRTDRWWRNRLKR